MHWIFDNWVRAYLFFWQFRALVSIFWLSFACVVTLLLSYACPFSFLTLICVCFFLSTGMRTCLYFFCYFVHVCIFMVVLRVCFNFLTVSCLCLVYLCAVASEWKAWWYSLVRAPSKSLRSASWLYFIHCVTRDWDLPLCQAAADMLLSVRGKREVIRFKVWPCCSQ